MWWFFGGFRVVFSGGGFAVGLGGLGFSVGGLSGLFGSKFE